MCIVSVWWDCATFMASCGQLETGHSGHIYTTEIGTSYKPGLAFFLFFQTYKGNGQKCQSCRLSIKVCHADTHFFVTSPTSEDIFSQYQKTPVLFRRAVTHDIDEWVKFRYSSQLFHFFLFIKVKENISQHSCQNYSCQLKLQFGSDYK